MTNPFRPEASREDLKRVEWRLVERREVRVLGLGIPEVLIQRVLPAVELRVLPLPGVFVVPLDGFDQSVGVDQERGGQLQEAAALLVPAREIVIRHDRSAERIDSTMGSEFGIHIPPPEIAVVPPTFGAFSRTKTSTSASLASSAAASPVPLLITITSAFLSQRSAGSVTMYGDPNPVG